MNEFVVQFYLNLKWIQLLNFIFLMSSKKNCEQEPMWLWSYLYNYNNIKKQHMC